MFDNQPLRHMITFILLASAITGCIGSPVEEKRISTTTLTEANPIFATNTVVAKKRYLFYLHGRIIEDQGIPAISPDYGEYEYQAIIDRLRSYNFNVISETREKNTDSFEYAKKVTEQIKTLLNAGIPAKNITVVGASKGADIAVYISNLLKNKDINYVIMAICSPETIERYKQNNTSLYGNVLSIYDSADVLAGSCQELFTFSTGKGLSGHDEIVLSVGTGHGILYKPLDEWIIPTIHWAKNPW